MQTAQWYLAGATRPKNVDMDKRVITFSIDEVHKLLEKVLQDAEHEIQFTEESKL